MKPYLLIKGSEANIADFEDQVSEALEQGYEFGNDLVTTTITNSSGAQEVIFIQPMIMEEAIDLDEIDEDL